MSKLINETFQKHLNLLHKRLNENVFEPENDTISAKLSHWLDQNSSGYNSTFEVDTILNDLDIEKGTPAFNELVDAFKESGFELKGNEFVKIVKKGSGVSDEKVKNTANQYIKHFGKGSSSLQMSARDFVSMSQGGGDPDVRSNFPNWSDENFNQLLDILYTAGGLKRPVDETFQKHLKLLHKKLNLNEGITAMGKDMRLDLSPQDFTHIMINVDIENGIVTKVNGDIENDEVYSYREKQFESGLQPFKNAGVKVDYTPWETEGFDDIAGGFFIDGESLNTAIKNKKISIISDPEDDESLILGN